MGFSHFHDIGILSGLNILAPYQIDIVKGRGFCNGRIILIKLTLISPLPTKHGFGRRKQHLLILIFYF